MKTDLDCSGTKYSNMEYHIISSSSIDSLPILVGKFLAQGWEPTGGPFALHTVGYYGQALIKRSGNFVAKDQPEIKEEPIICQKDIRLFNALKEKRMELANNIGAPPYCIATNRTLQSMITIKPKTREQMLMVLGFGPRKVEQYGDVLLKVIADHSD